MENNFSISVKLRALRTERNLSQRELAQLASLSPNSISLIERNEISPSVSTLQNLASALAIKISYFFDDVSSEKVLLIKANDRPSIKNKGVQIQGTGKHLSGQSVEPFHITIEPHAKSGERQVVHIGYEIVCCQSGKIEYLIDGSVYKLEKGDFLVFDASQPHIWRNPHDEKAEFLLVLQTPNESRDPVNRHFADYPSIKHLGKSK
jgi:transcriptional regulator with XRE-family HTH domain